MFAGPNGLPDPNSRAAFVTGTSGRVVDIQMGPDGRLYYVDFDGGAVCRIDSFLGNQPPQASVATTPTCSGGGELLLTLPVNNDWGSGYCAVLSITNDSDSATASWQVAFDTQGTSIYTSWNGNFSANSGLVSVTPIGWNSVIQPGATDTSIGFCANRSGGSATATPVSITGVF
jgi:hypothetical protein